MLKTSLSAAELLGLVKEQSRYEMKEQLPTYQINLSDHEASAYDRQSSLCNPVRVSFSLQN